MNHVTSSVSELSKTAPQWEKKKIIGIDDLRKGVREGKYNKNQWVKSPISDMNKFHVTDS